MITRSLAFAKALENVVNGVNTPLSWRQPPPVRYNAPPNTIQGQTYRYTHQDAEGPPCYPRIDQHVRGDSMPQHSVPGLYNRMDPHGIRLRPVSDLRMPFSRRQACVPHVPPPADAYRGLFKFGVFNAIQSTCFDTVSPFVVPAVPCV